MMKRLLLIFGLIFQLSAQAEHPGPNPQSAPLNQQVPLMILQRSVDSLMQDKTEWLQGLLPYLRAEDREALLFRSLSYLQQNNYIPKQNLQAWLAELALERPQILEAAVIDGYEVIRPTYDYPALARSLILNQVSAERSQLYLSQLLRDEFQWSLIFRRNNPLLLGQQLDVIRAFSHLSGQQLAYIQRQMPQQLYFPDNHLRVVLAMGIGSDSALNAVLRLPMDQYSVSLLEWVRERLPPERAFSLLKSAAENPELLYFAYSAIARLGRSYPPAAQFILAQFRDSEHRELAAMVMIEMQSR
ncbi:hypothetical protein [Agarivorans gilvus]|uniref:HEAT repeat domain-containing protein n=1 Tax=Agarivorans gilvus TaxID=680279 RepID=A0ABQ1I346_9ALTE|nr:hypothetical protein [Agarivorans gilvus]GGB04208.1 hypothetical protein GCM10007414_16890 [Agarivorans gilvus]